MLRFQGLQSRAAAPFVPSAAVGRASKLLLILTGLLFAGGCAAGGNQSGPGTFTATTGSTQSGTTLGSGSSSGGGDMDATVIHFGNDDAGLSFSFSDGSSGGCVPQTCAQLGANCGPILDGCGTLIQCGECDGGVCGAMTANVCSFGMPLGADGGACVSATCDGLGVNCGAVADGCGKIIQCGVCEAGASCGTGGKPNVCSAGNPDAGCKALTCADQGIYCGMAGDGCGKAIDCNKCSPPNTCGGGGKAGVCGALVCKPTTCAAQGIACGPAGDGCGNTLQCGNGCPSWQSCGGGGKPGQCGCAGVCSQIPTTCAPQTTTTLTGTVMDPGGVNPLYNALVYIPNNPADPALATPLKDGVTCDVCGANAAGAPLVTTHSKTDGTFVLQGVPVGSGITLVVQLGRWRRLFHANIPNACATNMVTGSGAGGVVIQGGVLTMPKNKTEGDIPRTAIVTGNADALECVFWKMGVDSAEFTNLGGTGRIQIAYGSAYDATPTTAPGRTDDRGYVNVCAAGGGPCTTAACPGNNACTQKHWGGGAVIDANTPSESTLFQTNPPAAAMYPLTDYDLTVLSCQGWRWSTAAQSVLNLYPQLVNYANSGGRIFATHFSYEYYTTSTATGGPNPFNSTATWGTTPGVTFASDPTGKAGFVDVNPADNPKGAAFASWLANPTSALSPTPSWMTAPANAPTVSITEAKWTSSAVVPPTQQWMFMSPPDDGAHFSPLLFTFNTPIGAANTAQCGRGLFSDFHVTPNNAVVTATGQAGTHGLIFPAECGTRSPMSAQEKVLEFMLFDLGACVQPYRPICTPTTCAAQGIECGPAGDGCGGSLDCMPCPPGQICGGAGPGKCGAPVCTPTTCGALGFMCGPAGDLCGKLLDCGPCPADQTCGGGGKPGACGALKCAPIDCAAQHLQCGPAGDGCGGTIDCGPCAPPQVCGGGGPGKCGAPQCTPKDCTMLGIQCGPAGDGCGNAIDCGPCPTGQICGFSGPGKCGGTR